MQYRNGEAAVSHVFVLNGKRFRPVSNSKSGRVASDALFTFSQSGEAFSATYSGAGFTDGHLIGQMMGTDQAVLIYHSRAEDGSLEAGEATAVFSEVKNGSILIDMDWRWLNGSKAFGTSQYQEILNE